MIGPSAQAALALPVPLNDQRPPPGPPRDLRPPPVARHALAPRRPEEAQARDPEGELPGDRPRDDQPVDPPEGIATMSHPEGRFAGIRHGPSSLRGRGRGGPARGRPPPSPREPTSPDAGSISVGRWRDP